MPTSAIWSLIISLVLLALGLTYKIVELTHALKLSEKEADRLRTALSTLEENRKNETLSTESEIDAIKEVHNKKISDIEELHQRATTELKKEIKNLSHVEDAPIIKELPEVQVNILKLLFSVDDINLVYISHQLPINFQTAKYHIEELTKLDMASCCKRRKNHELKFSEYCKIEHLGRKYLIDNGIS